jgi:hypothetical protein
LAEVGKWLKVNGESVQATNPNPFPYNLDWGYVTTRRNKVYLHVMEWPAKSLTIYGIKNKVKRAHLLADANKARLTVKQESTPANDYYSATVRLPATAPDKYDSVIVLETTAAPNVFKSLSQQPDGGISLDAYLGELHKAAASSTLRVDTSGMLGGWVDVNDSVSWEFKTFRPGTYEVSVLTSSRGGRRGGPPPAGTQAGAARGTAAGGPPAGGRGFTPQPWQGGQKLLVELAGKQVHGTLADNGRVSDPSDPRSAYVVSKLGTVTIDKPGTVRLVLKSEDAEAQSRGLSLHSVRLKPVK